jgi:hypothetical protein
MVALAPQQTGSLAPDITDIAPLGRRARVAGPNKMPGRTIEAANAHEMYLLLQKNPPRVGDLVIDGRRAECRDIAAYAIAYLDEGGKVGLLVADEERGGFCMAPKIAQKLGNREAIRVLFSHVPDWLPIFFDGGTAPEETGPAAGEAGPAAGEARAAPDCIDLLETPEMFSAEDLRA